MEIPEEDQHQQPIGCPIFEHYGGTLFGGNGQKYPIFTTHTHTPCRFPTKLVLLVQRRQSVRPWLVSFSRSFDLMFFFTVEIHLRIHVIRGGQDLSFVMFG